jgi:hypothetical protein
MAKLKEGGDLPGIRRAENERRLAAPGTPLFGRMQCQLVGFGGPAAPPDPAIDLFEETGRQIGCPAAARTAVMGAYLSPGGDLNNGPRRR